MTAQEQELMLNDLIGLEMTDKDTFKVNYSDAPQEAFAKNWRKELEHIDPGVLSEKILQSVKENAPGQMRLF
jgi:hypothetical protein